MRTFGCAPLALLASLIGTVGCGVEADDANGASTAVGDISAASASTGHAMTEAGRAVCRDALPSGGSEIRDRAREVCLTLQSITDHAFSTRTVALWEVSQVINATLSVGIDHVSAPVQANYAHAAFDVLKLYRRTSSFSDGLSFDGSSSGLRYYDDNGWAGQDLVRLWRWGEGGALDAAKALWIFELTGDDSGGRNYHDVPAGGMFWNTLRLNRGTVTNGTAALFGVELHDAVGSGYLDAPTRWWDWVHANLQRTEGDDQMSLRCTNGTPSGLFFDHLKPDACFSGNDASENVSGSCPRNCASAASTGSYGAGVWIGFDLARAKDASTAAERTTWSERARFLADANSAHYTSSVLESSCPAFNAIYFRHLLDFNRHAGTHYGETTFQTYKDFVVRNLDGSGLFTRDYSHIEGCDHELLSQAGAFQILVDDIFG